MNWADLFIGFWLGWMASLVVFSFMWRRDAIKHKAAEYYLDKNWKRWRWLND